MDWPDKPKVTAADFFPSSRPNSSLSQHSSSSRPSTSSRHARLLASYALPPTYQANNPTSEHAPSVPITRPQSQDKSVSILESLGVSEPIVHTALGATTGRVHRNRSAHATGPTTTTSPAPPDFDDNEPISFNIPTNFEDDEEYELLLPESLRKNKSTSKNPVKVPTGVTSPKVSTNAPVPYSLDAANDVDEEYLRTLLSDLEISPDAATELYETDAYDDDSAPIQNDTKTPTTANTQKNTTKTTKRAPDSANPAASRGRASIGKEKVTSQQPSQSTPSSLLPSKVSHEVEASIEALNARLAELEVPVVSQYANLQRSRNRSKGQGKAASDTSQDKASQDKSRVFGNSVSSDTSKTNSTSGNASFSRSGIDDSNGGMMDLQEVRSWRERWDQRLQSLLADIDQVQKQDQYLSSPTNDSNNDNIKETSQVKASTNSAVSPLSDIPLRNIPTDARSARSRDTLNNATANTTINTNNNNISATRQPFSSSSAPTALSSTSSTSSSTISTTPMSGPPARVVGSVRIDPYNGASPNNTKTATNGDYGSNAAHAVANSAAVTGTSVSTGGNVGKNASNSQFRSRNSLSDPSKLVSLLNSTKNNSDVSVHQALALAAAVEGDDDDAPIPEAWELLGIDYGLGSINSGFDENGNWRTILGEEESGKTDEIPENEGNDILRMVEGMEKESADILSSGQQILSRILEGVDDDNEGGNDYADASKSGRALTFASQREK